MSSLRRSSCTLLRQRTGEEGGRIIAARMTAMQDQDGRQERKGKEGGREGVEGADRGEGEGVVDWSVGTNWQGIPSRYWI